jgi:hypothetical protein
MESKLCECGCGEKIIIQRHHLWHSHKIPRFILGHDSRIPEIVAKRISNPNYIASRKDVAERNKLPKYREIMRKSANKHFADEEWKEKIWRPSLEKRRFKITKFERELISLVEEMHLPFRFVGDGSLYIGGKIPDFIATDGRNLIIEISSKRQKEKILGSWEKYEENRISHFKKYSYETEFIWHEDGFYAKKLNEINRKHQPIVLNTGNEKKEELCFFTKKKEI